MPVKRTNALRREKKQVTDAYDDRVDVDREVRGTRMQLLARYDRRLSRTLHHLKLPLLDLFLLPTAMLFGSYCVPLLLAICACTMPPAVSIVLILSSILTVLASVWGKAHFKRERPDAVRFAHRWPNVRALVNNESFPSGDSAQAGVFGVGMASYTNNPLWLLVIPFTMWSRIHFGCHWLGDTIIGACLGGLLTIGTILCMTSDWTCFHTSEWIQYYGWHGLFTDLCVVSDTFTVPLNTES